jgi:2-oxoglutarate dehydrogenase complex dehydrogenase (E1) component-like enzyme
MGAWNHIKGRLYEAHDDTHEIRRVSRQESASPATGSHAIHQAEVHDLMESALGGI